MWVWVLVLVWGVDVGEGLDGVSVRLWVLV